MRLILRILLFPITLLLTIFTFLLTFLLGVGTWLLNIISGLIVIGAIASFITHETITDKDERTIIQTPLYFWSMPQIVKEYLSMITWKKKMN